MAAPAEGTYVQAQPESGTTLRTIVELVRHIVHADVISVVSVSLEDKTITWLAASGFRAHVIDEHHHPVQPITNEIAYRAFQAKAVAILQGIGVSSELPAEEFPVHVAEGVVDLALAPLATNGHTLGALMAGYRGPHSFTPEEKQQLQDLAGLAALALENVRLLGTVRAAGKIWAQTFDAIGEGILVHDYGMRIVRCNAAAAEMMNLSPEKVIGIPFSEAFALLFGKRAAAHHLPAGMDSSSAFEVLTESGRRYLISIFPIKQPDGDSVNVVTFNDVTQLSEMQEQLARTRRLASVGQLAAGVAHEINNPLAAITTCAEATMRDMNQTDGIREMANSHQWSYFLEEIVRQALRCKDITRGLLDLTRQRDAMRVMCDLNSIASQCAKVAIQGVRSGNVELGINLNETIGEVATDAPMVRQILDNLLSNAIDALGEPGGEIIVSTAGDSNRVFVGVADSGPGIPAAMLARVFDPFFSTKGAGKGYGLGLAISATLAESLGGSLTVESKEGAGSRFRLWIPRRAPEN